MSHRIALGSNPMNGQSSELDDMIARATDAKLARMAEFFQSWQQVDRGSDLVAAVLRKIDQELAYRRAEDGYQRPTFSVLTGSDDYAE